MEILAFQLGRQWLARGGVVPGIELHLYQPVQTEGQAVFTLSGSAATAHECWQSGDRQRCAHGTARHLPPRIPLPQCGRDVDGSDPGRQVPTGTAAQ